MVDLAGRAHWGPESCLALVQGQLGTYVGSRCLIFIPIPNTKEVPPGPPGTLPNPANTGGI